MYKLQIKANKLLHKTCSTLLSWQIYQYKLGDLYLESWDSSSPKSDPQILLPFLALSHYLRGLTPKSVLGAASHLNSTPTGLMVCSLAAPYVLSGNRTPGRGPRSGLGAAWRHPLATGAWSRSREAWALGRHIPLALSYPPSAEGRGPLKQVPRVEVPLARSKDMDSEIRETGFKSLFWYLFTLLWTWANSLSLFAFL